MKRTVEAKIEIWPGAPADRLPPDLRGLARQVRAGRLHCAACGDRLSGPLAGIARLRRPWPHDDLLAGVCAPCAALAAEGGPEAREVFEALCGGLVGDTGGPVRLVEPRAA